ncbi:MAG: hypothetical protein WD423_11695 [Rhodothermales bacterium]
MPELKTYRLYFKEGLEIDVRAADAVLDQSRKQVRFTGENGKFIDDLIVVMEELQAIIPSSHIRDSATTTNGRGTDAGE